MLARWVDSHKQHPKVWESSDFCNLNVHVDWTRAHFGSYVRKLGDTEA